MAKHQRRRPTKWQRRWFTLSSHYLYYYNSPQDKHPKGIINLHDKTRFQTKKSGNRYLLKIERGTKSDLIACTSAEMRDQWVDAILQAAKVVDKKTKRKQEKAKRRRGPAIPIEEFSDLPKDCQVIVEKCEIPLEDLQEHFDVTLNILRFRTGFQLRNANKKTPSTREIIDNSDAPRTEPIGWMTNASAAIYSKTASPSHYQQSEAVGKGGYGTVYKGHCEKYGEVAIKVLQNQTEKQKLTNIKETTLLMNLNHENIVSCYEAFKADKDVWLVMEFLRGGTISQVCALHTFTEAEIAYSAHSILLALQCMHGIGLIHRDLKSANILLTVEGMVKLIDFGLCVDNGQGPYCHMAGSPFWMPPEMIRSEVHSFVADVWSFGICVIEFANGEPPNRKSSLKAMFTAATGGEIPFTKPSLWSSDFKDFMHITLQTDPHERATVAQLLDHPFLKKKTKQSRMKRMLSALFAGDSEEESS